MSLHQTILALETETWEALKINGSALIPYLAQDSIMIFPGAPALFSATSEPSLQDILNRKDMKPWTQFELDDVQVLPIGPMGASISYRAVAQRDDTDFEFLTTSIWRDSGEGWKLLLHQQTPL